MQLMPGKMSESDRSFALNMMWVGFVGSWALILGMFFGFYETIDTIAGGVTAGSMIGLVFFQRQDEYAQRLFAVSGMWACAVVGLLLFATLVDFDRPYRGDAAFDLIVITVTFHTVFAILRIRERS